MKSAVVIALVVPWTLILGLVVAAWRRRLKLRRAADQRLAHRLSEAS